MSDNAQSGAATSAADLLGGDGGQQQQQQDQGQQQQQAPGGEDRQQQGGQPSWLDSIEDDPDLKAWAQGKNFPSAKEALAAYRGLETLLGREKLPLPKDEADKDGWERVHKALGRPDEPAGYALDKIDGADPAFTAAAAGKFHELGLSTKQAQGLAEFWQNSQAASIQAAQEAYQATSKAEMGEWLTEVGAAAAAQTEQARRAMRTFGLGKDQVAGMERAVGTKAFMTMMSKIGGMLSEDSFEGGDSNGKGNFGMSVEDARSRLSSLMQDKDYAKSYINGDATKRAEVERLNRIISAAA